MKINDVAGERKKLLSAQFTAHKLNQTVVVVVVVVIVVDIDPNRRGYAFIFAQQLCGFSINSDLFFISFISIQQQLHLSIISAAAAAGAAARNSNARIYLTCETL